VTEQLRAAMREFNAGRFFEAHECLEELLDDASDADFELLLGLIQVAVGYHKLTSGHDGGARLLAMGRAKLDTAGGTQAGLDIAGLRSGVDADLARLESGHPAELAPPRLTPARA
jgi:uncharacterized protein